MLGNISERFMMDSQGILYQKKQISEANRQLKQMLVVDLSQYLGHILVETVKPFFLLLILQIPVGLDSESSYGFDFGYKILQCS